MNIYSSSSDSSSASSNFSYSAASNSSSRSSSMPILANPTPISGQSVTSYVLNHRTSPLCGMVPSLLGGRNPCHHAIPIPAQYRPILCQAWADPLQIQCKPSANRTPIQGHSLDQSKINQIHLFANLSKSNANPLPILCQSKVNFSMNLCQSLPIHANPSQSNANFRPIRDQLRS